VTRKRADSWADKIRQEFRRTLIVISREDLITSLSLPSNASLCASHLGINVQIEPDIRELADRTRHAITETIVSVEQRQFATRRQIALRMARMKESTGVDLVSLSDIRVFLTERRRITLEAPAGRGKTTTLVQLARQTFDAGHLPFLIDLPEWVTSGHDVLEFISQAPPFRSRNIHADGIARLSQSANVCFLLNGWNEIAEDQASRSGVMLRKLEREFPSSGIIVATRNHYISPPLPGAFRFEILPLTRDQRDEYIEHSAGRANDLRSSIEENHALDELTRIPLILSEVTSIFQAGQPIPITKVGVLDASIRLMEEKDEHQSALRTPPLSGNARDYLGPLALEMGKRSEVTILESEARAAINSTSEHLRAGGQISTIPEPASILNVLCAHHILEKRDYPATSYRFAHQQFQEFFGAVVLREALAECVRDPSRCNFFVETYVNEPVWDEPLRMIAEHIERTAAEERTRADGISMGKLLITMALDVDPVFAAELSKLSGPVVWNEVKTAVSERLRAWFQIPDQNHKHCALTGMLATGSQDFNDILMPLLLNDDQQVRLATYRAGREFDPFILGPDWRNIVSRWTDQSRVEFLHEVTLSRWRPRLIQEFAQTDPSSVVRAEAIEMLCHVGPETEAARILSSLNDDDFEMVLQKLPTNLIPARLRTRATEAYTRLVERSEDTVRRLRLLLEAFRLRDPAVTEKLKSELDKWQPANLGFPDSILITDLLNVIGANDPDWVSGWIATRMARGVIRGDTWAKLITRVPAPLREELFTTATSRELQHPELSATITLLTLNPDPSFAARAFGGMCAVKKQILAAGSVYGLPQHAILRQLETVFRNIPPNVSIAGIAERFGRDFDSTDLSVLVEALGQFGSEGPDLRNELEADLQRTLRGYLKRAVPFALAQEDFSGALKSHLATALARVGEPEDIDDLQELIRADLRRFRTVREARIRGERNQMTDVGMISYANWYVRAVMVLDPERAAEVLLNLLSEQEYERECAIALATLARTEAPERQFPRVSIDYGRVWHARGGQVQSGFDEARKSRYAAAIRERVNVTLEGLQAGTITIGYWFKSVATVLAELDAQNSAALVLKALAVPGRFDGWARIGRGGGRRNPDKLCRPGCSCFRVGSKL